jgi:hypothetical protein
MHRHLSNLVFLATLLAFMSSGAAVHASEGREGWTYDVRLGAGVATVSYDEQNYHVADFEAFVIGGALRLGGFIGPHFVLGAELAATWGAGVGTLRTPTPDRTWFYDDYPRSSTYGYFAPLGVFMELYPWTSQGWFVSASAGVGLMQLPQFAPDADGGLMSRYAVELGYELSHGGKQGAAVYLRLDRWSGEELPFSEHPDGLVSSQLLAGMRWTMQ